MNSLLISTVAVSLIFPVLAVLLSKKEKINKFSDILIPGDRYDLLSYILLPLLVISFFLFRGEGNIISLFTNYFLIFFGYVTALSDFRFKIIPNKYMLMMLAVWACLAILSTIFYFELSEGFFINSGLGFVSGGGVFMLVYLISKGGLGGGDVKFAAVAGLYLTMSGILPAVLYGSVLSALTGLILIATKRMGKKDTIPLAPFLFIGMLITIFIL